MSLFVLYSLIAMQTLYYVCKYIMMLVSKLKIYYSHWVIFNVFDSKNVLKNYVAGLVFSNEEWLVVWTISHPPPFNRIRYRMYLPRVVDINCYVCSFTYSRLDDIHYYPTIQELVEYSRETSLVRTAGPGIKRRNEHI